MSTNHKPLNIEKLELSLDPNREDERNLETLKVIRGYEDTFGSLDLEKSYMDLFELLWNSQLPCTDVKGIIYCRL